MDFPLANCPICNKSGLNDGQRFSVRCKTCGEFNSNAVVAPALHGDHLVSGYTREAFVRGVRLRIDTPSDVEDARRQAPKTVAERLTRLLKSLAAMSEYPGDSVEVHVRSDRSLAYCRPKEDMREFLRHLEAVGYIVYQLVQSGEADLRVTTASWMEIDGLAESGTDSSKAFVAMSFSPDLRAAYDEGIVPAVEACGYGPVRIDGQHFLDSISDRIVAHIRESRFVVADMTDNRAGVYFEGGFALGLGLPVLWTCRKSDIDKVHFDTRHFNHLAWETPEELRGLLEMRVRATIGLRPGLLAPAIPGS